MPTAGRKFYDWAHAHDPYAPHWEDLTAVDRRWWNREADRTTEPYTPAQRVTIWVALAAVCWAGVAGLVAAVWWVVTR